MNNERFPNKWENFTYRLALFWLSFRILADMIAITWRAAGRLIAVAILAAVLYYVGMKTGYLPEIHL